MILHFDDIGLRAVFFSEDMTPESCVEEIIWTSHLTFGFAEGGSCLYGDCEVFI